MNEPYPPLIPIPLELSDDAAAQLIEALYEVARVLENHYAGPAEDQFEPGGGPPV